MSGRLTLLGSMTAERFERGECGEGRCRRAVKATADHKKGEKWRRRRGRRVQVPEGETGELQPHGGFFRRGWHSLS